MAITRTKGNMMSFDHLDIKLVLLLSMFYFQSVCVKGRELSKTGALSLEGRRRLFHTFSVKSFGAQADGQTDDTNV